MIGLIDEACSAGARLEAACDVLGLTPRTVQRWREGGDVKDDGRLASARNRVTGNCLDAGERQRILEIANSPEFASKSPSQIVPALADRGEYIASESTFYRVLRAAKQLAHRGKAKAPRHSRPKALVASAPNQVWSWDITYLATTVAGMFFYLYIMMDVFSRKIVGWDIYAEQNTENADKVFAKAHLRENIGDKELVLHSDNGSPMKGATLLATLQKLGVVPSFSRPSVSNDNPYSEALFKTCKYHPSFPEKPFESVEKAREWAAGFVNWYNEEHLHSGIRFVTPGSRHRGEDQAILDQRKAVYNEAKEVHPERWSRATRNWNRIEIVTLNPFKTSEEGKQENSSCRKGGAVKPLQSDGI